MAKPTLVVIAGPTAIGKTELAITVAQHFNTEIVSADSRQFYQEMEIGTAKPSSQELNTVKHHFINSHTVTQEFSVGEYETAALATISHLFLKHNLAVLAGGSGLFIKAITQGFDDLPKSDPSIRTELNLILENEGIAPLQKKLESLDPQYFKEVDLNNPQRIIRALEVSIATSQPFSSFRSNQQKQRPFGIIKIGLNTSRETLYNRINQRVDNMIANGLVAEVESLRSYRHLNALNTVGYSEIFDYLDGDIPLTQAIENIKQNTRRFAKRQLTWFRKDLEITWFEPADVVGVLEYVTERFNASQR